MRGMHGRRRQSCLGRVGVYVVVARRGVVGHGRPLSGMHGCDGEEVVLELAQ